MGCDMMVALSSATVSGQTLFGANLVDAARQRLRLRPLSPSYHSPDETVQTAHVVLPQVRQTCGVLGVYADEGWGLELGVNEYRVVVGVAGWRSRLDSGQPGLTGAELTRLALERSHSALQAVEVLTDLIGRFGQHDPAAAAPNAVFLIADVQEACTLEAAGTCWALLECPETRAVSDVGLIRQDWQRLSHGVAEQAIHNGWWRDDGTKLDFAGSLAESDSAHVWALKRWSRATLALAQRQGALDPQVLRQLLADHYVSSVRGHPLAPKRTRRLGSLVTRLDGPGAPLIWFGAGPASAPLYFPLVVGADLPEAWTTQPPMDEAFPAVRDRLQNQFDQDAEEYLGEARELTTRGEPTALRRLGQTMMLKHLEQWEVEIRRRDVPSNVEAPISVEDEELIPYAFE